METFFSLLFAYLVGSIPFGVILAKAFDLPDPRSHGSGNIGATNMLRTGRKEIAAATLALDMLKGVLAVSLVEWTWDADAPLTLLAAMLGHVYSPWLSFKGGKGVATALGGIFALDLTAGVITAIFWLITFYGTRISSLSALVAISFAPFALWAREDFATGAIGLLATALIFYTHRENIKRLMRGKEPRFERNTHSEENL
jgi:glycerol-3-phosphate acyltransferase PlsY